MVPSVEMYTSFLSQLVPVSSVWYQLRNASDAAVAFDREIHGVTSDPVFRAPVM